MCAILTLFAILSLNRFACEYLSDSEPFTDIGELLRTLQKAYYIKYMIMYKFIIHIPRQFIAGTIIDISTAR
jgi:hypothetical protein